MDENDNMQAYDPNYNILRFLSNVLTPTKTIGGVWDGALYLADVLGAPSNATNELRDLATAVPQHVSATLRGTGNTLRKALNKRSLAEINTKNFLAAREEALRNLDPITKAFLINPLVNSNMNYSKEELEILKKMARADGSITNADIKRVNKKYGNAGGLSKMFNPAKAVELSIGQASGKDGYTTDVFDVNTETPVAKHDNAMYWQKMMQNPGLNYQTIRATMPYYNSLDIMPDDYKIHTRLKLK